MPDDLPYLLGSAVLAAFVLHLARSRRRGQMDGQTDKASAEPSRRQPCVVVRPPSMSKQYALEHSTHRPSRLLRRDIELVFRPDLEAEYRRHPQGAASGCDKDDFLQAHLLAIPTWQPATSDLSEMSARVNAERKQLLDKFDVWVREVRARLGEYWCDCSCPMEGHARFGTPTSTIYNELEGLTALLKYDAVPVGCCGIVLHPTWGRRAYPVTLFTTAPPELVQRVFEHIDAEFDAAAFRRALDKAAKAADDGEAPEESCA